MWRDTGTWIALGVSVLFILAGVIMHRLFVQILKNGSVEPSTPPVGPDKPPPSATPLEPHE